MGPRLGRRASPLQIESVAAHREEEGEAQLPELIVRLGVGVQSQRRELRALHGCLGGRRARGGNKLRQGCFMLSSEGAGSPGGCRRRRSHEQQPHGATLGWTALGAWSQ